MRLWLAIAAIAAFAWIPAPASGACVGTGLGGSACSTGTFAPEASVQSPVEGVSAEAQTAAPTYAVLVAFYGPSAAFEYKHLLVPDARVELLLWEASVQSTYSYICGRAPGAGACVPYLV